MSEPRRPAECADPRSHVDEEMTEHGINYRALQRMARSWYVGDMPMSDAVARELADGFGTSPEFWLNLDASYQRWKETRDGE